MKTCALVGGLTLLALLCSCGKRGLVFMYADEEYVRVWNEHRTRMACTALAGSGRVPSPHVGDHIVCSNVMGEADSNDRPDHVPDGYYVGFYTSGCPTCAVGWVLKKGRCGDPGTSHNCYD